ncbi:TPA: hypothetical protein OMQ72_001204 [Acinetobacter baumannii]|nr:hypothetical protein [Acinetobacter baumannii]
MNLTDFQKRLLWGLVILFILILWIIFPLIFKEWVFSLLVNPPFTIENYASLGPIGDIFGGLTAFFTSLTLIIVLYTAYLQRQANKDAREAMEKQLQQAKHATELQLREARRALEIQMEQARQAASDQIAHASLLNEIQLKHAQQASYEQLEVARASYQGQIEESRYAIFSNMFYSLLNYKQNIFSSLELNEIIKIDEKKWRTEKRNTLQIIRMIANHFYNNVIKAHPVAYAEFTIEEVRKDFYQYTNSTFEGTIHIFLSYFLIYVNILDLIKKSKLSESDKATFKNILRNSMFQDEQVILFWISPLFLNIKSALEGSEIFTQFEYEEAFKYYALRHYNDTYFGSIKWKQMFNEQNPA